MNKDKHIYELQEKVNQLQAEKIDLLMEIKQLKDAGGGNTIPDKNNLTNVYWKPEIKDKINEIKKNRHQNIKPELVML